MTASETGGVPDPPVSGGGDEARLADADELGRELVRLVRLIERSKAQFAARSRAGVEYAAYVLLGRLVADGPQRLSGLAEAVHSDPSTVSRQVAALVRSGLVERRSDPQDRRAWLLAVTGSGWRLFDEHRQARNRHIAAMLARWPDSEVRRLVELLERLNNCFEDYRCHLLTGAPEGPAPAEQSPMVGEREGTQP